LFIFFAFPGLRRICGSAAHCGHYRLYCYLPAVCVQQRHSGLFYVTAYTAESLGASAGLTLADAIQARFNGSSAIITSPVIVRIEYSEVKLPLHDPPFYAIPVEIGWYAFRR
jgi:hypothetical protein